MLFPFWSKNRSVLHWPPQPPNSGGRVDSILSSSQQLSSLIKIIEYLKSRSVSEYWGRIQVLHDLPKRLLTPFLSTDNAPVAISIGKCRTSASLPPELGGRGGSANQSGTSPILNRPVTTREHENS